jgi:LmbE family N-acetylglucosaminyl deacetylase
MKRTIISIAVCIINNIAAAQYTPPPTSSEILNNLQKLYTVGSVLYIAAHPDDENTRLLAWLSKERKFRTGYLSLTRGDGGQNLIGTEQGIELGLIRTQELLAARRTDGAEQFFSRAFDFGFSKTDKETLSIWNKEKILSDVVWVIRNFKPDVIITRFPNDNRAGHGHHWASAGIALEAFDAAADPNRFPEQLKYVSVWQAKRLCWNTYNFGGNNTTSETQLKIDVGVFNPLLGKSYGEIASESRSQHKSQGFGVPRQRGESFEYFLLQKGDEAKNDLMDGINTSWMRIINGEACSKLIEEAIKNFNVIDPSASIPKLLQVRNCLLQIKDEYWKKQKLKELDEIILQCAGIFADAFSNKEQYVSGDKMKITVQILNRSDFPIMLKGIAVGNADTSANIPLEKNKAFSYNTVFNISEALSTQPYWLNNFTENGSFNVEDQLLIGKAQNDAAVNAYISLSIGYETIRISRPVMYKFTDPVKGELYQPVSIIPAVTAEPTNKVILFPANSKRTLSVKWTSHTDSISIFPQLSNTEDFEILQSTEASVELKGNGSSKEISYLLKPKATAQLNSIYNVKAEAISNNKLYDQSVKSISYDHIPTQTYLTKAVIKLVPIDLKISGKKIGYIEGAGDLVPDALTQMGYEVKMLKEHDLLFDNLKQYDAIITGIRAYNVHEYLNSAYAELMKYIENGGNMIVQYNTSNQIGPVRAKISPYPFNISRSRVTEEKAPVTFLLPQHPVLNTPNKITEKDFDGWIQERSVYMAEAADSNYQQILSMHDSGETDQNGSLIIARYGKGNFVYTGLVFFRELPAGIPGAYRLMANLIALPKNK